MRFIKKPDSVCQEVDAFYAKHKSELAYDYPFVRERLDAIYGKCCAYCGIRITGATPQIEHFYPKADDTEDCRLLKNFRNLHYSCSDCNNAKKTADMSRVLSPNYFLDNGAWKVKSTEIREHLHYSGCMLFANAVDSKKKGENTIRELKLNSRVSLLEERARILRDVQDLLEDILYHLKNYRSEDDRRVHDKFEKLIRNVDRNESFSEMVLQNYGKMIAKLLEIWKRKRK